MAAADLRSTNPSAERWMILWSHRPSLLALARTRTQSDDEAEDVVQEAIYLAATSDVRLDTAGAWLNRVVRNKCADQARQRQYGKYRVAYEIRMSVPSAPVDEAISDDDEAHYLGQCLERLPKRQRDAIVLVASGLNTREIAAHMGTSTKAVEHLRRKARRTLQQMLAVFALPWLAVRSVRDITIHAPHALQVVAIAALVSSGDIDHHEIGSEPPKSRAPSHSMSAHQPARPAAENGHVLEHGATPRIQGTAVTDSVLTVPHHKVDDTTERYTVASPLPELSRTPPPPLDLDEVGVSLEVSGGDQVGGVKPAERLPYIPTLVADGNPFQRERK